MEAHATLSSIYLNQMIGSELKRGVTPSHSYLSLLDKGELNSTLQLIGCQDLGFDVPLSKFEGCVLMIVNKQTRYNTEPDTLLHCKEASCITARRGLKLYFTENRQLG